MGGVYGGALWVRWEQTSSRVLKKSVAFAHEAGIVSVVDIDMPDKASSGAKCCPSATTDRVILVLSFPRELRTG